MKKRTKLAAVASVLAAAILLLVLILRSGEEREVKNVIIAYNAMLMKAHAELKPGLMQNLAGEREVSRIDNYMAYLLKNQRSLHGEVKEIEIKDVKITGDAAAASVSERWVYRYADPVTRAPVTATYDVRYGNTYFLKKVAGRWIVDDIESRETGGRTEE